MKMFRIIQTIFTAKLNLILWLNQITLHLRRVITEKVIPNLNSNCSMKWLNKTKSLSISPGELVIINVSVRRRLESLIILWHWLRNIMHNMKTKTWQLQEKKKLSCSPYAINSSRTTLSQRVSVQLSLYWLVLLITSWDSLTYSL
jgi:hypothetical protein